MSTVCRNCRVRVQRLQDDWNNTPSSSGSRKRAPGILRSQHGLPYNIHNRRTDLSVLECRRRGPVSVSFVRPKSLRFLVRLQAEYPHTYPIVATGLKPGRKQPSAYLPRMTE